MVQQQHVHHPSPTCRTKVNEGSSFFKYIQQNRLQQQTKIHIKARRENCKRTFVVAFYTIAATIAAVTLIHR